MQLSVQSHAQQQADALVHIWGKRASVQIGEVRYHLLRNALILHAIHIERGNDTVDIAQILLRANPKLLTGSTPRIGMVDISGLNAEITGIEDAGIWQHDHYLGQIWQAAAVLTVHDGNIKLHLKSKHTPPLELKDVSWQQRLHASTRTLTGSARMQQGRLTWQWFQNTAVRDARNQHSDGLKSAAWLSKGALNWSHLDIRPLLATLQWKEMHGYLDGKMTWETARGTALGRAEAGAQKHRPHSVALHGEMQLNADIDTATSNAHRLLFSASTTDGQWQMDMNATTWPLDPWSDALPKMGARQLVSGQLDGKIHWQGQPGNWTVSSEQGVLQDIIYARPDRPEQAAWYWSRIHYDHAVLDTANYRLRLSRINMFDSRLELQMQGSQTGVGQAGNSAIVKQQGIAETGWNMNADRIDVHNMMLAVAMPQGKLKLEAMDGQMLCLRGKPCRFKLHTNGGHTAASGPPEAVTAPQWKLRGKVKKNRHGKLTSASIIVDASQIPVARLRSLLPLQDDADRPVQLAGVSDLNVKVDVSEHAWQMQGDVTVRDLALAHGGNSWLADQVRIRFGPVGAGMVSQHIDSIESQGWRYIAALHPLSWRPDTHASNESNTPVAAWWVATLRNNNIAIDHLALENGQISVGQRQSVWAEQVNITADNIKAGQWADIAMRGSMGGGAFFLNGQWQALSNQQHFRGDAGVDQATPFFLNNWMQASGMPRLIRGRLSVSLHVGTGQQPDSYQGVVKCQLLQAQAETGVFTSDPMLARIGYTTTDLLQRLEKADGVITLQYDINGQWAMHPLNPERLGLSMQQALHQAALHGKWRKPMHVGQVLTDVTIPAHFRLHERERLSQNERNRLFKVVSLLRQHPEMIVDLRARWAGKEISEAMLRRIRFTQQLIEDYMAYRNIDKRRIFPLWPTAVDQAHEAGSVQVEARITR